MSKEGGPGSLEGAVQGAVQWRGQWRVQELYKSGVQLQNKQ